MKIKKQQRRQEKTRGKKEKKAQEGGRGETDPKKSIFDLRTVIVTKLRHRTNHDCRCCTAHETNLILRGLGLLSPGQVCCCKLRPSKLDTRMICWFLSARRCGESGDRS